MQLPPIRPQRRLRLFAAAHEKFMRAVINGGIVKKREAVQNFLLVPRGLHELGIQIDRQGVN